MWAVGFAQVQLRRDYVGGNHLSPVGYLEGIYVEETYRRRGIAFPPYRCRGTMERGTGMPGIRQFL